MAEYKLKWGETGSKLYETGVKNGVLYVYSGVTDDNKAGYGPGVAWNGLTAVTESPSGAEPTPLYADDSKYLTLTSAEEIGATIEAFTYPDEFMVCDGSAELTDGVYVGQQTRKRFALCYTTTVGNDEDGNDHGKKLHILYGCLASPSEKAYATINDSPEAITFSWEVTCDPIAVTDMKPTASIVIDSTKADEGKFAALLTTLYGTAGTDGAGGVDAKLLTPDEIMAKMTSST